jgi:ribosomal protein S18 acetylase RimI-like enzyme
MRQFDMTCALMDDILFSMEDQEGEFYVDTYEGVVVGGLDFYESVPPEDTGGERLIELPEWDSSDGFRLMERFSAGFHNALIREQLTSALNRGKGVFRAFKDILSQYPEAEKLWFAYKEQEMKKDILRWYNGLREEWGLEKIGVEPEETCDLVREDFRFRRCKKTDSLPVEALHASCLKEAALSGGPDNRPVLDAPGSTALVAESGGGEFAGYIYAVQEGGIVRIHNLEVKAEFRGLGIGEALLVHLLETLDPSGTEQFSLDLPSSAAAFAPVLAREGFEPYLVRYFLDRGKNGSRAGH